jgi:DNA-binding transcriptional regulator YhcF (GntR family)
MPRPRRPAIAEALRHRVQRGLASGALRPGDRLPSTREMAADLDADPRVVADAYRVLAADGLVELRPRAGVFVGHATAAPGVADAPSAVWLADVVAEGVRHGVGAPVLAAAIEHATRARPLQAAVVAATVDQAVGIARELRDDFGIVASAHVLDQLPPGELPRSLARAQLLVGTEFTAERVQALGARFGVRVLIIDVRPDLLSPEWRLLLREAQRDALYVVIVDPRFGTLVHTFLRGADGAENVRVLVAGEDDVEQIPAAAAAYVTEAARERLGRARLPMRLVAPARTLSDASVRAVAEALVTWNVTPAPRRRRAAGEGSAEPGGLPAGGTSADGTAADGRADGRTDGPIDGAAGDDGGRGSAASDAAAAPAV